jgi:hypothetical protein
MNISEYPDTNVAGLFGCNEGVILDVSVSGSIAMDVPNDRTAYVGGIVGWNKGTIVNCVDNVVMDGVNIQPESLPVQELTYTLKDNLTVEVKDNYAVKLVGQSGKTYNNVQIVVQNSDLPSAYIILENANIKARSGVAAIISNDPDRKIYLVSKGNSNRIDGVPNAEAIYLPDSELYVVGDAPLTVKGADGANAVRTNSDYYNASHSDATDGFTAVKAGRVIFHMSAVCYFIGGNGGNGVDGIKGPDGEKGGNGENQNGDHPGDKNDGKSGSPGKDGTSGTDGKSGATALVADEIIVY